MHTRNILNIVRITCAVALLLVALSVSIAPPTRVEAASMPAARLAQAGSAMDLIGAVNALRAHYGLQAYSVDGGLMAEAQNQSAYQASILSCTHARADGSSPGDHGISAENVACGMNLSVSDAIYGQWTDQVHNATMVGPDTGQVGAGVVTSGGSVYYTLAVRRLSGEFVARAPVNSNTSAQSNPQQDNPTQPPSAVELGDIATSTPNSDGSIAHVLKYGETLVEIAKAYGLTLNDLIAMNHLDPKKPVYFAGQVLTIRVAFTLTPFITTTYTPRPPTRTPLPTRTPKATRTPEPVYTPQPTPTMTSTPLFRVPTLEDLGPGRSIMAYAFITISALGLVVLLFSAFLPEKKG